MVGLGAVRPEECLEATERVVDRTGHIAWQGLLQLGVLCCGEPFHLAGDRCACGGDDEGPGAVVAGVVATLEKPPCFERIHATLGVHGIGIEMPSQRPQRGAGRRGDAAEHRCLRRGELERGERVRPGAPEASSEAGEAEPQAGVEGGYGANALRPRNHDDTPAPCCSASSERISTPRL